MSQGFTTGSGAIALGIPGLCEGRLTLTSGTPITTSDVTGATSVYFTPFGGGRISLYDGSSWITYAFSEIAQALGTLTSDLPYDIFAYLSGGSVTTEMVAWTNGTTRATALVLQNGVYVKSGSTTKRYLGTFHTTSTTTTEDSASKRYLWNYYNRVLRLMQCYTTTDSYSYSTATIREAEASGVYGTSRVGFVIGLQENLVSATNFCIRYHTAGTYGQAGIGLDTTTAFTNGVGDIFYWDGALYDLFSTSTIVYRGTPAVGFHYLARLEKGIGVATVTWYGDNGDSEILAIMYAEVMG